jgi:hypothetical protein
MIGPGSTILMPSSHRCGAARWKHPMLATQTSPLASWLPSLKTTGAQLTSQELRQRYTARSSLYSGDSYEIAKWKISQATIVGNLKR